MVWTLFRQIKKKKTTNPKNVRGIVLNTADLPGSQLQSGCVENVNNGVLPAGGAQINFTH
jgi:hypothetical protein